MQQAMNPPVFLPVKRIPEKALPPDHGRHCPGHQVGVVSGTVAHEVAEAQLPGLPDRKDTGGGEAASRRRVGPARGGPQEAADVPVTWHPRGPASQVVTFHVVHTVGTAVSPLKTLKPSPKPQGLGVRPFVETGL